MTSPLYARTCSCLSKRLKLDHARSSIFRVQSQRTVPERPSAYKSYSTILADIKSEDSEAALSSGLQTVSLDASSHTPSASASSEISVEEQSSIPQSQGEGENKPRQPRSVQAVYLRPLKRHAKYGVPSCDLQLRSYSVRNLEFFTDFALRAAYYLNLPAAGPIFLPRMVERWTVPRSNFIFKKSQENFERITLRRLIQIKDGHPEAVEMWLAFLRKHQYYGVGMKANVWEYEKLGVGKTMDVNLQNLKSTLEPKWAHFGRKKNLDTSEKVMDLMNSERFRDVDSPFS